MPLYPCKCDDCGHRTEVVRPVSRYRDMPECCGKPMTRVLTPLHVIEDMKPYRSPLDGSIVTSRDQHRNHMRKHDVVEVGNEKLEHKAKPYDDRELKQDIANVINSAAQ